MAIEIPMKRNDSLDKALRRLKRETMMTIRELKDRRYFQKPSVKKRIKSMAARKRKAIEEKNANHRTGL